MLLASLITLVLSGTSSDSSTTISVKDFIRLRCGTDGEDAFTTWSGTMYANIPQEKQRALFGLTGMNVASCFQDDFGAWYFSTRELMYYLDLETGKPLTTWHNPWTNETVPVVHVANSPVQGEAGASTDTMPAALLAGGSIVAQSSDVELYYPNPLAGNKTFAPYSPWPMYEGGEFFKFFIDAAELGRDTPSIPRTWFAWGRNSQWLPFMKMGATPGGLFCSTTGSRTTFEQLPAFMQRDITERLPLYRQAPGCLQAIPDSTSWTYFKDHFEDYLSGTATFPIAAPNVSVPCQFKPILPPK